MIVILTALELEHAAVRTHLENVRPYRHPSGTLFDIGAVIGHPDAQVALAVIGAGNATAAALTERAIAEFQPSTVLFVGVAGGLRDWLSLGDVVVATRVYGYHGGRAETDEFLARPRAWDMPHHIEQLARHVARTPWSRGRLPATPTVHFDPIAAGEVVLNSTNSPLARQIHTNYNDAIAVEMESAGVAHAGHLNMATPTATVRGISDLVNAKDDTDLDGWQPIAARNAAAFAVALTTELDPSARSDQRRTKPAEDTNTFNNHGSVDTQIGTIHGGFTQFRDRGAR
jgi:adenosylhomocysteine nucleosidase